MAKPALPFAVLKRRLERRLKAVGVKVLKVHEEEWSYIPVGGPLPVAEQNVTAFGAAASLIHPATGFSVSRSFREAPKFADEIQAVLKDGLDVPRASRRVWEKLWTTEGRAQVREAVKDLCARDFAAILGRFGNALSYIASGRFPCLWHGAPCVP